MAMLDSERRPPSVDALARALSAQSDLPHALLVDCARRAIASDPANSENVARDLALQFERELIQDVINATGVLLHTNLGRAPMATTTSGRPTNLEFTLDDGSRGVRHTSVSQLISLLTGAQSAVVVNNNAAAVMLVAAALAEDRDIVVSRGESVEIGGGFRIPEVIEQSGARLIDVGTTNKTRLRDYERAVTSKRNDVAFIMKIHPSNFSMSGFTSETKTKELATLSTPIVVDIGSGLLDNACPWLVHSNNRVPEWLANEPAARQAISDGASLVTFSGDKLLGGPQCGIIAGSRELVDKCAHHPLMRALRPGSHVLIPLQQVLLSYVNRSAMSDLPFWKMLTAELPALQNRADRIVQRAGVGQVVTAHSVIGAGSASGVEIPSIAIELPGNFQDSLRQQKIPIISRMSRNRTFLDLRTIAEEDDDIIVEALKNIH
jgi:L-seryl-tRNA(Ser) seleniumtransferase